MAEETQDRLANHYYQTDKVLLLPYIDHRGAFPDHFFVGIYEQLQKDGTLDTVFAGMPNVSLNRFVSYLSKQPVVVYIIKPNDVVGFGWITQSEGIDGARKASFGFTFFRKYWGTQLVRDLCWFSLRWWFTELNIDILFATLLKTNRLAANFSRIFGFKKIGELPMFFQKGDSLQDGTLIYLKRADFDPLYDSWHTSYEPLKLTVNGPDTVLTFSPEPGS